MSSTVLYLAIVAVWAVVLVPMWLRRDTEGFRLLHRREDPHEHQEHQEQKEHQERGEQERGEQERTPRRPGRAAVIARRRRRTTGLTLLLAAAAIAAATGLAPWWVALPPVVLLAGHLALLREAVRMDLARRQAQRPRRAPRPLPEEPVHAEIIDFVPRNHDVFDQYADDRRAVGD